MRVLWEGLLWECAALFVSPTVQYAARFGAPALYTAALLVIGMFDKNRGWDRHLERIYKLNHGFGVPHNFPRFNTTQRTASMRRYHGKQAHTCKGVERGGLTQSHL